MTFKMARLLALAAMACLALPGTAHAGALIVPLLVGIGINGTIAGVSTAAVISAVVTTTLAGPLVFTRTRKKP